MFFYSSFKQRKVVFAAGKITYLYTATGEKVQKKVTQGSTTTVTDYVDGFQYVAGALSFFPTAEGYFNAETQNYVYQHLDHLGNVRVSYSDANKNNKIDVGEIVVENNYYPFGLAHKGYNEKNNTIARNYKYQYNAKELQEELGFNVYDYGARNYDAAIGRWMNVDPLAEKMPSWNPYTYTFNNPIMFTDPTGMIGEGIENEYKVYTSGGQVQKVDYISNKGGDFVDHVTYVNLDTPAPYAPETTTEVQFVQHSESKIDTNLSVLNGKTAQTIRGPGSKHDVKYQAQSQGIQSMEFDSPFFVMGGASKIFTENKKINVFRAFGGDARAQGFSWTPIDPSTVKDFRNVAGLPSGGASGAINTANFMIEGQVRAKNILKTRSALPLDGNVGGLPEFIINPKNVRLTDFKVINP